MKPSQELRQIVLKKLVNRTTDDRTVINNLFKPLALKFKNLTWVELNLMKMDINHDGLINCAFQYDFKNQKINITSVPQVKYWLTPDGIWESKHLN